MGRDGFKPHVFSIYGRSIASDQSIEIQRIGKDAKD